MRMYVKTIGIVTGTALTAFGVACSNSQTTPPPDSGSALQPEKTAASSPATRRGSECPLSQRPLSTQPGIRRFAGHDIQFHSEAEAATFDELPGEEKRIVAGRQLLARKGVVNETCIVTRRPLPVDAEVLVIEGVPLGFTSAKYVSQFQAIPIEVRNDLVGPYLVKASGITNTICPVTEETLHVGCPNITVEGVMIGFKDEAALQAFRALDSERRNELTALLVLPVLGISNTTCPVTGLPLRMDSPIFEVDGVLIGVRNVEAARSFNTRNKTERIQDTRN